VQRFCILPFTASVEVVFSQFAVVLTSIGKFVCVPEATEVALVTVIVR
jgi:hypothetical protein